jgi:hypothetical protein
MADTIVSLKLDFKTAREGGMAVSAVWRLVYLLATHSHWNQGAAKRVGGQPLVTRHSDIVAPLSPFHFSLSRFQVSGFRFFFTSSPRPAVVAKREGGQPNN